MLSVRTICSAIVAAAASGSPFPYTHSSNLVLIQQRAQYDGMQVGSIVHEQQSPGFGSIGSTVPLTEKGYQTVASLKDDKEMKAFIHRVLEKEARYAKEPAELSGLVPFYSGTQAHLTHKGAAHCDEGDSLPENLCLQVAQRLLPGGTTQGRTILQVGSYEAVPVGCSVQSGGDWAAHYNRGNGANDGGYTKVCAGPQTEYMILGYGMPNCAEGKTIDTHEECEAAHIALGLEVAPKWTGTYNPIPGYCSTREVDWGGGHHFHFNSLAVGTIRVDLSPVCKV